MRSFKVVLPLLNGTLALVLMLLGLSQLSEQQQFIGRPDFVSHTIPKAWQYMFAINLPAFVGAGLLRHVLPTQVAFLVSFLVLVLLLWYLTGSIIDRLRAIPATHSAPNRSWWIAATAFALLAAACIGLGINSILAGGPPVIPAAVCAWGAGLLCLLAVKMRRQRSI
jgi:uncharacterized membrane protein YfcA